VTPFGAIMRDAVEATPGAIGGAFADAQGEMIDGYSTQDPHDWAVLTAHYGVVLALLDAAFRTLHFGGPQYFIAQHQRLDVLVHAVYPKTGSLHAGHGYYALLAVGEPGPLGHALVHLRHAARKLQREIA
jgi:hypothetical protein